MSKALSGRRSLLGTLALMAAAALTLAVLLPAGTVAGAGNCGSYISTDYFFDAAKTQYAGSCDRVCNCVTYCSGTITEYKTVTSEPCG